MGFRTFAKTKKMTALLTVLGVLLSLFLLTVSFYHNSFEVVGANWFRDWQNDSESLVTGRLIRSRQAGMGADFGILQRDFHWEEENRFVSGAYVERFQYYPQQIGLQGMIFGALDRVIPLQGNGMLQFLYLLNAFLLAAFITLTALWARAKFGILSGVFLILGSVFSPWLVVTARNLYWVTWTFLLPFVMVLYLHWLECHSGRVKSWHVLLVAFLGVFLRVANGFEFVSAVLISTLLPVIFYAVSERWTFRQFFRRSLLVGLGGLGAFFAAVGVNLWQRSMLLDGLGAGFSHLQRNVFQNTGAAFLDPEAIEGVAPVFDGPILTVIHAYFHRGNPLVLDYRMGELFLFLLMLTLGIFLHKTYAPAIHENRRRLLALALTIYASLLGPISWFILAKSHSYVHRHINYFLWFFPGVLLLFALFGAVVSGLLKGLWQMHRETWKRCAIVAIACVAFLWPLLRFYQAWDWGEHTQQLRQAQAQGLVLHREGGLDVIHHDNALFYVVQRGADTSVKFFLHATPLDGEERPFEREFEFSANEISLPFWRAYDVAKRPLPDWEIETLLTGQFDDSGRLWEISVNLQSSKNEEAGHD